MNWNLEDLLDSSKYESHINNIREDLKAFGDELNKYISSKTHEVEQFKVIVLKIEDFTEDLNRLYGYASLHEEKNQRDLKAAHQKSLSKELISLFEDTIRPFTHWFKGLNELNHVNNELAEKLMANLDDLSYHYKRIRELAKHTLKEKEEEIISKKDMNLLETLRDLRSQIETKQMYNYIDPNTKKKRRYSNSAMLLRNIYSSDDQIRENTYKSLFCTISLLF